MWSKVSNSVGSRFYTGAAMVLLTVGWSASSSGQGSPAPAKAPEKKGSLQQRIMLSPPGLVYRTSFEDVVGVYSDWLDSYYAPRYTSLSIGPETEALDAKKARKKEMIQANLLEFGSVATGWDNTALKAEYSYGNGESMTYVTLPGGTRRFLFFFDRRLWKVYDEYELREGGALGASYDAAVTRLTRLFGVQPVKVPRQPDVGRYYDQAVWLDPLSLVRLIDRHGEQLVVLSFSDRRIEENLGAYRKSKPPTP